MYLTEIPCIHKPFVGPIGLIHWDFNKVSSYLFCYLAITYLFLITCFQILLQNWMAFTNLRVDNFTITDSHVFSNTNSPSHHDNYAFCQVRINHIITVTHTLIGDKKGSNNATVCLHDKWSVATINFYIRNSLFQVKVKLFIIATINGGF